jgi:RIP metalloprotease RseP
MGAAIIIIGIILMVVIHEMGHFVAAKFFNMKATEAFWGFGPKLWSTTRGETEYGVKALPLGGYVRIVGMNPLEEVDPEEEHRTYRAKPFYQKAIVVLAGITSHFVIAFILFLIVVFAYGSSSVGEYNQERIVESVTAVLATPNAEGDDAKPIRVLRNDEVIAVDGVPIADVDPNVTKPEGTISVIRLLRDDIVTEIETTDIVRPSPARIAGIQPGDELLEFDGETVATWEEFVRIAHRNPGQSVDVVVGRDGERVSYTVPLTTNVLSNGDEVGFFGVSPVLTDIELGFFAKLGLTVETLWTSILAAFAGLWALITNIGSIVSEAFNPQDGALNTARPISVIGLVRLAGPVESSLTLLAFVNVFVGVLNVIPLYPLDGGHFAVATYEKIRGRPVDIRPLLPVAATVFLFLVVLGVFSIVLDIVNPIRF